MLELSSHRSGLFCFRRRRSAGSHRHEWNMKGVRFVIENWKSEAFRAELAQELRANPGMAVTKVANIICKQDKNATSDPPE